MLTTNKIQQQQENCVFGSHMRRECLQRRSDTRANIIALRSLDANVHHTCYIVAQTNKNMEKRPDWTRGREIERKHTHESMFDSSIFFCSFQFFAYIVGVIVLDVFLSRAHSHWIDWVRVAIHVDYCYLLWPNERMVLISGIVTYTTFRWHACICIVIYWHLVYDKLKFMALPFVI